MWQFVKQLYFYKFELLYSLLLHYFVSHGNFGEESEIDWTKIKFNYSRMNEFCKMILSSRLLQSIQISHYNFFPKKQSSF